MFKYITHNKKLFYITLLTAPIAVGFDIGLAWLLRIITDAGTNGEKQRIAIARLLNENFDCILLDESTSSLDKNSVDIVEECILSKKDLTVIAITHHLTSKAIEMSDCILKLENGKLVPVTM